MINSLKVLLFLALFASSATFSFAAFNPSEWTLAKPIIVPPSLSGYVRAILDDEVYKGSANGKLSDLRIMSSAGQEIAYQLVSLDSSVRNAYYPSTLLDLSEQNGEVMFILDLGSEGLVHDRLNIISSSQNFKRQVSVYASSELLAHESPKWRNLTSSGYIYNFADTRARFSAGSGEVVYPKSTSRYVRVVVHMGLGEQFHVTGANVHSFAKTVAREESRSLPAAVSQNLKQKTTEIVADLGATGIPTHRLLLSLESGHQDLNFDRRVVIHGSDDGVSWRMLGEGYVSQLRTALFTGSQLALEYPESNVRYVRAVVFNLDNAPLPLESSLRLFGVVRALVFEVSPEQTYVLYYGNPNVAAPRYDIARFFQYIETENIASVSFGKESLNTSYVVPPPPTQPFTETRPQLLNIVLVVLVVVVTALLFVYIRKLKLASHEEEKE